MESKAQLQSIVSYMPNISIVGSKNVLLEWTADDHIRIYEMDFDANKATAVMLDTPVSGITKVTGSVNMLTFHVGTTSYRILFAAMQTGGLGPFGLGVALNELNASGINLWISKLKQSGVQVKLFGWGKTLIIAILLVVVVAAVVIAVEVSNGTL